MARKPGHENIFDDIPVVRPEDLVKETRETLKGPGPCARCRGPKFEHAPHGGIAHLFVPMSANQRAAAVAQRESR